MGEFEEKLNAILSSPKDMEKIMALAKEIGGAGGGADTSGAGSASSAVPDGIDPKLFKAASRILGEYANAKNDKAELMRSLKPYVRQERRRDLDRAAEIAKIAGIAKIALAEFGGGGNL